MDGSSSSSPLPPGTSHPAEGELVYKKGGWGSKKQRNTDRTLIVRDLSPEVDEPLLEELFTQMGRVESLYLPRERLSGTHFGYAFVEMKTPADAEYALAVLQGVALFGRPLRCAPAGAPGRSRGPASIGAKLFVGKLHPTVTSATLQRLFSPFGQLLAPPLVMAPQEGEQRKYGYALVDYSTFEAADAALAALQGYHLMGQPLRLEYAINKDADGARHGSQAERELARRAQMQASRYGAPDFEGRHR
jgi:splicing factor 3B subunit 4